MSFEARCNYFVLGGIDLPCLQVAALEQVYHNALSGSRIVGIGLVNDGVLVRLQVVALGLVAHPGAYLRSPWNQLDAVVVITSIISTASPNNHVGILKALRLLRVLRPLRMISRFKVTHVFLAQRQSDLDQGTWHIFTAYLLGRRCDVFSPPPPPLHGGFRNRLTSSKCRGQ